MKKIIFYSLIVLVFVGFFGVKTFAQTQTPPPTCISPKILVSGACIVPTGTCLIPNSGGTSIPNQTLADCNAASGTWTSNYYFLSPLPDPNNSDKINPSFDPSDTNALGGYINLIIKLIIGIAAVMAVVMIVIGGMQYMTSELISGKEEGKERIEHALLGLLIALGSYALLNTINPNLLSTDLSSVKNATVQVPITNFQIASSGPQSRYGTKIVIDFNSQAYPAAVAAQAATGVDPALVLAIFNQETSSGGNTGACFPANANMTAADQTALASIVGPDNIATTHVSCSLSTGHGGAIGLTQFLPTTWNTISNKYNATAILGHSPDPWNVNDALMMTSLFLKNAGGAGTNPASQQQAACSYFGACSSSGINYGAQVMAQTASVQQQIATAKANGTIK